MKIQLQLNFVKFSTFLNIYNTYYEGTESIEQSIDRLLEVGVEGAKGYSHRNSNSFTLSRLKLMAEHLGIPKSLAKENLIKAIITKKQNRVLLQQINEAEDSDSGSELEDGMQTFVVNKNTFPRLCNILMTMPIALQRCNLLATRAQLQNRETGGGSPLFVDADLAISDHIAKIASTIQENAAGNSAVQTVLAKKAHQECIQSIFRHIVDCDKMVNDLEKAENYDANNPSKLLLRYRRELKRAEEEYEQLVGDNFTTP